MAIQDFARMAARFADAVMRGQCASTLVLRSNLQGDGTDASELGLDTPATQDVELGAALIRKSLRGEVQVTVSALVAETALQLSDPHSVCTAMMGADSAWIAGEGFQVTRARPVLRGEKAIVYELLLEPATAV